MLKEVIIDYQKSVDSIKNHYVRVLFQNLDVSNF